MEKQSFKRFVVIALAYGIIIWGIIIFTNVYVDAASVIRSEYTNLAKLVLEGNIVSVPDNYNERDFQYSIIQNMKDVPDYVVIGSSRGMYIGEDVTGYSNIYNNCVSGACIEDYYALLGLYQEKFQKLPTNVIIEVSPWVFYKESSEARWQESDVYCNASCELYEKVNCKKLKVNRLDIENPYLSYSYFRYNISHLKNTGDKKVEIAKVSDDKNEAAEYPDGTIRYIYSKDHESEERLKEVQSTHGACTYENSNNMTEVDINKSKDFEALIDYLLDNDVEVTLFLSPFSVTQSEYSFDQNLNPGFSLAENYLRGFAAEKGINLCGGYDARDFGLDDSAFIDFMHLDKSGTDQVWNFDE